MNDNLTEKLKELKKQYLVKLASIVDELEKLTNSEIIITELYSIVHKISGTSGMYGLRDISNLATDFEFYLKPLKDDISTINPDELSEKTKKFIQDLKTLVKGE